jgi:hypothetical protein
MNLHSSGFDPDPVSGHSYGSGATAEYNLLFRQAQSRPAGVVVIFSNPTKPPGNVRTSSCRA